MKSTKPFPTFMHGDLTVVEVALTDEEIQKCLEMGKKRTELDEKKLGWKYRHHGMKSELAHAIGFMGERAFQKWLNSRGLQKNIDYTKGKAFVETHEEVEQDFTIWNKTVGVKSADNNSLNDATKFDSFLYPAKQHPDESKRLLGYPDYLVQTVVSRDNKKCWICGYAEKEDIVNSPIDYIVGKPAHKIPIKKYKAVDGLIEILKAK